MNLTKILTINRFKSTKNIREVPVVSLPLGVSQSWQSHLDQRQMLEDVRSYVRSDVRSDVRFDVRFDYQDIANCLLTTPPPLTITHQLLQSGLTIESL